MKKLVKLFIGLLVLMCVQYAHARLIKITSRFSQPLRIDVEGSNPSFEKARKAMVPAYEHKLVNLGPATILLGDMPSTPFVLEFVTIMGNSQKAPIPKDDKNIEIDIDESGNIRAVFNAEGKSIFERMWNDFVGDKINKKGP